MTVRPTTTGVAKQKVSLSLDADLVAEFEKDGPLSRRVNEALRAELERRQHQEALGALVASLVEVYGPLDTPEDLDAIEHYKQLLT